jgi:hypothetical protein
MRVDAVGPGAYVPASRMDNSDQVRDSLEALSKLHNTTVPELVKSAEAAGSSGPAYLVRVLVLNERLKRLDGQDMVTS